MQHSNYKKETWEDKFERKFWAGNKAKLKWVRFIKRFNNHKYRRKGKEEIEKEIWYGKINKENK